MSLQESQRSLTLAGGSTTRLRSDHALGARTASRLMAGHRRFAAATRLAAVLAVAGAVLIGQPAGAATPSPSPNPSITMTVQPLLGGTFAPGSWIALRVTLENSGPAVDGELTLTAASGTASTYSRPIQLATGARQEHFLYGRLGSFGNRVRVTLTGGSAIHARETLAVDTSGSDTLGVFVVADRPETLVGALRDALSARGGGEPDVVAVPPEDLPARVEAWSAVDVLIWQDIESARLDAGQLDALRTWVMLGGDLVVLAGTTGTSTFGAFPDGLLPYRPSTVVDVAAPELEPLLGRLPPALPALPALVGRLEHGVSLAGPDDAVIAARGQHGQGSVAMIGLNPATPAIVGSAAADALWGHALPARAARFDRGLPAADDFLVNALAGLPSVQLPRSDHVLLLVLAYVIAIGPANYLLLKRRDRRELAWLTIPLTIGAFAVAAYAFGVLVKGANVIVNELVVVESAAGVERGLADVHVGVFSPARGDFDVRVGPAALISSPTSTEGDTRTRPLDIVLGDPAAVRDYGVGFGAVRAFRAQATVDVPLVEVDFRLVDGSLQGTVRNASSVTLLDVAVVHAGGASQLGDLAAGESRPVSVAPGAAFREGLSWRLYPPLGGPGVDSTSARTNATRRAVIQHLGGGWEEGFGNQRDTIFGGGPVVLAWRSGGLLDIDVGDTAERTGETLYVLPARAAVSGPVVFSGGLLERSTPIIDSADGFAEADFFVLSRGTIAVEYRPVGFDGTFEPRSLAIRLSEEGPISATATGGELLPLPADEQPASDSPMASNPRPAEGAAHLPRLQLFDRLAERWVEFEPADTRRSYTIPDAGRYVDEAGAFRVRFVLRSNEYAHFAFSARLEGTVE